MLRIAYQAQQQVEPMYSVLVKRASRGSAAPGSSLFAATLTRISMNRSPPTFVVRICGAQAYRALSALTVQNAFQ
jgi:hypothetical protein